MKWWQNELVTQLKEVMADKGEEVVKINVGINELSHTELSQIRDQKIKMWAQHFFLINKNLLSKWRKKVSP